MASVAAKGLKRQQGQQGLPLLGVYVPHIPIVTRVPISYYRVRLSVPLSDPNDYVEPCKCGISRVCIVSSAILGAPIIPNMFTKQTICEVVNATHQTGVTLVNEPSAHTTKPGTTFSHQCKVGYTTHTAECRSQMLNAVEIAVTKVLYILFKPGYPLIVAMIVPEQLDPLFDETNKFCYFWIHHCSPNV